MQYNRVFMSVAKTTQIYYGKFANTYEIELHGCRLSFFSITRVHSMRKGERKCECFPSCFSIIYNVVCFVSAFENASFKTQLAVVKSFESRAMIVRTNKYMLKSACHFSKLIFSIIGLFCLLTADSSQIRF